MYYKSFMLNKKIKFDKELINKHFYEVSDLYNDNKDLIESKFKEGLIEDYIGDYYKFISYEEEEAGDKNLFKIFNPHASSQDLNQNL